MREPHKERLLQQLGEKRWEFGLQGTGSWAVWKDFRTLFKVERTGFPDGLDWRWEGEAARMTARFLSQQQRKRELPLPTWGEFEGTGEGGQFAGPAM